MNITDNAFLFDVCKDTKTYQHASTMQLFRTVDREDGKLELFIMNEGTWRSEGTFTPDRIAHQVANPN